MEYTKELIGAFIRKGREDLHITQEKFSEILNCNSTYYGDIERGKYYPSLKLFLRMVSYLNLSTDKLVQQSEITQLNVYQQLLRFLNNCTETELQILLENAQTLIRHRTNAIENKEIF